MGEVQKGWGLGEVGPPQEEKSFKCYCLEWHTSTGMTAKYGIYFYFLCKQGGISPFGVEWVGGGSGRNPDGFIWMIQENSIFYIFHTLNNDRYNGFGESYIYIYIYIYEVRVLVRCTIDT